MYTVFRYGIFLHKFHQFLVIIFSFTFTIFSFVLYGAQQSSALENVSKVSVSAAVAHMNIERILKIISELSKNSERMKMNLLLHSRHLSIAKNIRIL